MIAVNASNTGDAAIKGLQVGRLHWMPPDQVRDKLLWSGMTK
jgi:hypothetical protein